MNKDLQLKIQIIINRMSKAFKKKKDDDSIDLLSSKLNFLLGSQLNESNNAEGGVLERSLILKGAMFWDTKGRVERIKSLVLSSMNLEQFEDVDDFKIEELASIQLLCLSKNRIIHLQPIKVLDTLVTLNINHNKVYDLSPIEGLSKLEELYASNNQIVNIDSLKSLENLRLLNLYRNKIVDFDSTYSTLEKIKKLEDLDIEQNPFFCQQAKKELILLPITRLNDKLVSRAEKEGQLSNKSIINMSSSCIINPLNVSMMMKDTKTSFFNPSSRSGKRNKTKQLKEQLDHLQDEYMKVDDEFQEEIVKNVQLKSQFHNLMKKIRETQAAKEENQYRAQQIKLLKRKAKDLKENLFTKDKKGQLLRALFELQTQSIPKKVEKKELKPMIAWTRRFDCDDVIIIEDDNKYLQEDSELAALLQNNSNTLEELRRQLQSMY